MKYQPRFEIECIKKVCLDIHQHSNTRTQAVNMDNIVSTFEIMVNSYTNADELMNFAATMGIQESPSVRFRLFQLQNMEYDNDFVNGELDSILQRRA